MSTLIAEDPVAVALFPRARRAILGLIYGHPGESFYLREIAERTGLAVGHVQREVARLSEAGVLRRARQGRHIYFTANEDCTVYDELRGLTLKTLGAIPLLLRALAPLAAHVRVAFVYGSIARREERAASDVDLFVVGDVSFSEVTAATREVERALHREVNANVYGAAELKEKLAAGNHFLRSVIEADKMFLIGGEHELGELQSERVDS